MSSSYTLGIEFSTQSVKLVVLNLEKGDIYLSDSFINPTRWSFPEDTIINALSYLVVETNGDDNGLEANFRLGYNEEIILTTPSGLTIIDSLDYIESDLPLDRSYGRYPDGSMYWMTFTYPTKEYSNN